MKCLYKTTFILGAMLCLLPLHAKKVGYLSIKPADFKTQIEHTSQPCIIDIRSADDFTHGHIADAVNIDMNDFQFVTTIKQLYPNTETIFVYCKLGKTSKLAAEKLSVGGFKNVISLKGGITAWWKKKLPTVTE